MDVCVENVFTTPAIEEINLTQATAEEENRGASFNPRCESQDKEAPRYGDAEQDAVARDSSDELPSASLPEKLGAGGTGKASARPTGSSETPRTETAADKKPLSALAWLGM